jgi:hypothetical protein
MSDVNNILPPTIEVEEPLETCTNETTKKRERKTNLTRLDLKKTQLDNEQENFHNGRAIRIFVLLSVLLVLMIGANVTIHMLNMPELEILKQTTNAVMTIMISVISFLFGTRSKK